MRHSVHGFRIKPISGLAKFLETYEDDNFDNCRLFENKITDPINPFSNSKNVSMRALLRDNFGNKKWITLPLIEKSPFLKITSSINNDSKNTTLTTFQTLQKKEVEMKKLINKEIQDNLSSFQKNGYATSVIKKKIAGLRRTLTHMHLSQFFDYYQD